MKMYYARIGYPLGIYEGKGRIENKEDIAILDKRGYTGWFFVNPIVDEEEWFDICIEKKVCCNQETFIELKKELLIKNLVV